MSDILKCPFCQQELQETYDGKQFWCSNYKDPTHPINMLGTKELWRELIRTRKALDKGMEHITGLNNMIESWYKLLQSDKDASTKYAILKSAISAYVENKGGSNE